MADSNSACLATPLEVTFTHETIICIREALLLRLAAFGEIERLSDAQAIWAVCGKSVPRALRVIHPTGQSDTICRFADALRMLG